MIEAAVERCEGLFACMVYIDEVRQTTDKGDFVLRGDECWWRNNDGTLVFELAHPDVTFYENYFTYQPSDLDGRVYFECLPIAASSSSGDGHCDGSPKSCSSISFVDCTAQSGCYGRLGNEPKDARCAGSATRCDYFERKADCEHQQGCEWQD